MTDTESDTTSTEPSAPPPRRRRPERTEEQTERLFWIGGASILVIVALLAALSLTLDDPAPPPYTPVHPSNLVGTLDGRATAAPAAPLALRADDAAARSQAGTDGAIRRLDTGQPVTVFGNAPLAARDGAWTHTPVKSANSAGYAQTVLDKPVTVAGATVSWPTDPTATFAIVLPSAPWRDGNLGPAGVHLVVNGDGTWHCSMWDGTREQAPYYLSDTRNGTFRAPAAGARVPLQVTVDNAAQRVAVTLPDGRQVSATTPATGQVGSSVVWELYERDGASLRPAAIHQVWAG